MLDDPANRPQQRCFATVRRSGHHGQAEAKWVDVPHTPDYLLRDTWSLVPLRNFPVALIST